MEFKVLSDDMVYDPLQEIPTKILIAK
jgi:hypothetical protein